MLLVAFIEVLLVLLCLVFGLLVCRGGVRSSPSPGGGGGEVCWYAGGGEVCWCAPECAKSKVVMIQIQKL